METPEFFIGGYLGVSGDKHYSPENFYLDQKSADNNHFTVDDLLDFSKDDEVMNDAFFHNSTANSTDSPTVMAVGSCNSSVSGYETPFSGDFSCRSFTDTQFSGELCIPYDDLAELEWLSNFVEDSISSDQFQNLQPISTTNISPTDSSSSEMGPKFWPEPTTTTTHPIFPSDKSVRGKARSKRSRVAPCDWSSRLLHLSPATTAEAPTRRCQHCGSEKTPQWRAGPMGPKTLCNACGVRFKSGRLVPEYRPAASPTFVSARHSNSHRKVLELRRQKEEIQRQQFISQSSVFGVSNGHDYLVPHHRRMI